MTLNMRRGFKPDHKSFGEFLVSDQARDPAVKAAGDIAELAAKASPRSKATHKDGTPHMADDFHVNSETAPVVVGGNPRVGAEVFNPNRAAAPNEFGGPKNRRHRMLGKAGAAIGEFRGSE